MAYNDEDYGSATVTLNSVTDTELTFTNEDGERVVFTRKNQDPSNPPVDVQDLMDKGLETRMTYVSNPFSILFRYKYSFFLNRHNPYSSFILKTIGIFGVISLLSPDFFQNSLGYG